MILAPIFAVLMAVQSPNSAAAFNKVELTQDSRALLRCSAAFAMVARGQDAGNAAALKWPILGARGREFFVQSLARLMDQTGLDRAGISRLIGAEAQRLWDAQEIDAIMPSCLIMLDASGV